MPHAIFLAQSAGIADVLDLTKSFAEVLPDLDVVASQGGSTLGERLAKVVVKGLSSSKTEIRSSSESLLDECVKNGAIGIGTVKKIASRQKPAIQRAIAPVIAKLSSPSCEAEPTVAGEESAPSTERSAGDTQESVPVVRSSRSRAKRDITTNVAHRDTGAASTPAPRSPRRSTTVSHPLVATVGPSGQQKSKAAVRSMTWPEYPEEPSGNLVFGALKKAWSPLIPLESARELFPDGGIKKQDDAMAGFELLSRAIVMEKEGEGLAIVEQLNFIWKWMTFVLCSKESTIGLQAFLQLALDLVDHLRSMNYELSDSEATTLVPHLFDKTSAAKVSLRRCVARVLSSSCLTLSFAGSIQRFILRSDGTNQGRRISSCKTLGTSCMRCCH